MCFLKQDYIWFVSFRFKKWEKETFQKAWWLGFGVLLLHRFQRKVVNEGKKRQFDG
jgi:hypothetical protein